MSRCCIGDRGPRGFQGDKGCDNFEKGPLGFQGAGGLVGFQGSEGIQGENGLDGPQGYQQKYVRGSQGPQGFAAASDTDQRGPQGFEGLMGAQGYSFQPTRGLQGTNGIDGTLGYQGAQGERGMQGITNPSSALLGFAGPPGFQGIQLDPVQGMTGAQGFDGPKSTFEGVQGSDGPPGPVGDLTIGPQGNQGFTGAQGPKGLPSTMQGAVGSQGFQGDHGMQGFFVYGLTSQVIAPNASSLFFQDAKTTQCVYNPIQSFSGVTANAALYMFSMTLRCPFVSFAELTLQIRTPTTIFAEARYTLDSTQRIAIPCFVHALVPNVTSDMDVSVYLTCNQSSVVVLLSNNSVFSLQYKQL